MAEEAKPTKTTTINNIQLTDDQFAALFGKQVTAPATNDAQAVQAVVLPQQQQTGSTAMLEAMSATMNVIMPIMCFRMMAGMMAGMCR